MPVENPRGLSQAQLDKLEQPYAHNAGPAVDYAKAQRALDDFDRENPNLWGSVARMLSKPQA